MAMDPRPPFTGKILRNKADGKSSDAPKTKIKEPTIINRERRVFGTVRNQNVLPKAVTEKPTRKPGILQKPTKKSIDPTEENNNVATATKKGVNFREKLEENKDKGDVSGEVAEIPSKESKPSFLVKPRKKSVNFREKVEENEKGSEEGDVSGGAGLHTPLKSPFSIKPNVPGTPYRSAERCSKCRFDKLETSSYWLGQIRLAESTGKHFVSAAFFRLASECKAEPILNMKVELKKYVWRHEDLWGEKEWRDLRLSYGLMKEDSNSVSQDNGEEGKSEDFVTIDVDVDDDDDEQEEEKQIMDQGPHLCGSWE